jgi:hypothetical protein
MDRNLGFHAGRAVIAEDAHHAPHRSRRARRLVRQLDHHDLPVHGAAELRAGHQHPVRDA